MADQMTPDELRIAAEDVDNWSDPTGNAHVAAQAARNLADVIEWATSVPQVEKYPTFDAGWEEAALHVLDIARGETTNHENRSE